ncbi:MAG: alpha/beta fold hydrolase [Burkholderiales bacterium]|nr:alpha/beta fold hydrolase [Burkholderiales bacterium]
MLVSRYATRHPVERGLVRVGDGYVHYRRGGRGPVVVALHASPRSSASLLPLLDVLADRHTVIALDTPGYGHSDPLASTRPVMGDFTGALGAAVDSLGLQGFALYGTHTGAALATAFALKHPGRVRALVLDGLAVFTEHERASFLTRYLLPFEPQWDGTHLAVLWSRISDHFRWFPWHERTPAARLATEPPPLDVIYSTVEDFLRAGDAYRRGYACAAVFDAAAAVSALRVPTLLLARERDLIVSHLDRVAATRHVRIARPGGALEAWADEIRGHFGAGIDDATARDAASTSCESEAGAGRMLRRWGDGYLHLRSAGSGTAAAIVVPDLPGDSAAALRVVLAHEASVRRAWAIDLPGCGASDPASTEADPIQTARQSALYAGQILGLGNAPIIGVGLGAAVAAPHDAARVIEAPAWMAGRSVPTARTRVPDTSHDADGGNFFASWYRLRNQVLEARPDGTAPDARDVQERHSALWTSPECGALARALHERVAADTALRARIRMLEGETS